MQIIFSCPEHFRNHRSSSEQTRAYIRRNSLWPWIKTALAEHGNGLRKFDCRKESAHGCRRRTNWMRARKWIHGAALGLVLLATFAIRALQSGQPIVENYVGRQIPTAMVARNLDRGSGFLRPQLDTAPFPNYFVVEPPIYESGVVVLKRATGLGLEEAGRVLSALATALAAWGSVHVNARGERDGSWHIVAVAAFAVFPLTIRYGRAFQPDAAMLGTVVAGLACGTNIDTAGDGIGSSVAWSWWPSASQSRSPRGFCSSLCWSLSRGPDRHEPSSLFARRSYRRWSGMRGPTICWLLVKARGRRPTTDRSGSGSWGPPRS